jgi:6,7-dimethyl-8-ribityllumazine synthase
VSAPETWPGEKRDDDGEAVGGYEDVTGGAVDEAEVDLDVEIEPDEDDDLDEPDELDGDEDEPDELGDDDDEPAEFDDAEPALRLAGQHAPGDLNVPDDVDILEGEPRATRRGVGIVAARFNGEVTNLLLDSAFAELDKIGVGRETVSVMTVPGAFELPLGAMALAKTRRYSCIVALGCVIRGETAHFEYISGEAASGLQLAALETGVPVSFGFLTVDTLEQAVARADKGAEAVRTALEMADVFTQLRATAQAR